MSYVQVLDGANQPVTDIFYAQNIIITNQSAWSKRLSLKVHEPDDALVSVLFSREENQPLIRNLVVKDRLDSTNHTIHNNAILTSINLTFDTNGNHSQLDCEWLFRCPNGDELFSHAIRMQNGMMRDVENERPGETIRCDVSTRPEVNWVNEGF